MQLRGLKVHFQEDAELMRGAGPCGCLQIVPVPGKGAGPCPELRPHPLKFWVSRVKSAPRHPQFGGSCFPGEPLPLPSSCATEGPMPLVRPPEGAGAAGPTGCSGGCWPRSFSQLPCRAQAHPGLSWGASGSCSLGWASVTPLMGSTWDRALFP